MYETARMKSSTVQLPHDAVRGWRGFLQRFSRRLTDRRFWFVQGLILIATGIHLSFDGLEAYKGVRSPDLFVVLMYAILFVPVVYASLSFGREGAIPTAIWLATLALPSIVFFPPWSRPRGRGGAASNDHLPGGIHRQSSRSRN